MVGLVKPAIVNRPSASTNHGDRIRPSCRKSLRMRL